MSPTEMKDESLIRDLFNVKEQPVVVIGDAKEPLYEFWKKVKAGVMTRSCYVVFLHCPRTNWQDLKDYPGLAIGDSYIMWYDTVTGVRAYPSQKGLFYRR
jgi:hypothetical protein